MKANQASASHDPSTSSNSDLVEFVDPVGGMPLDDPEVQARERRGRAADELAELYTQLTNSRFNFMPRGEHRLQDVFREVQARFPQLCDDHVRCMEICTEGNQGPEWQHRVRAALQVLKSSTGSVVTERHGYWIFS